jgi:hypothetical protein
MRLVQKDAMLTSHQTAIFCSRHIAIVKGKVCQIASRSVGKAWQRKEKKSLEMHCIESLIVAYVLAISNRCPKDSPSAHKGLITKWPHRGISPSRSKDRGARSR